MTSLNTDVNALHQAFCDVTGREMAMTPGAERWLYEALKCDVTPQMIIDVMTARMKRQYANADQRFCCLSLRHCIGDDDRLAQFVDEAAQIAATKRKRVYVEGKVRVLEATGRATEPEPPKVRHVSEIFDGMRKAT